MGSKVVIQKKVTVMEVNKDRVFIFGWNILYINAEFTVNKSLDKIAIKKYMF